jgi:phosphatidylinositol alpha 1,6-mannosyltransferase
VTDGQLAPHVGAESATTDATLKIVLACETYSPDINGAAVFARRLAHGLVANGHVVHVLCPSPTGNSYQEDDLGVHLHRLPALRYRWHSTFRIVDPRTVSRAVSVVIEDVQPDVIHVQAHFLVGRSACVEASKRGIRLVATNHFMPENLRGFAPLPLPNSLFKLAAQLSWRDLAHVFRRSNVVTAPTQHAVDLLRQRAHITGAIAVSCGVNLDVYKPGLEVRDAATPPTILYVGRLDADKRVGDLLGALAVLGPGFRARIVGRGSKEAILRGQARDLGLDSRVDFLTDLADDQVRNEYQNAEVFCMTGVAELQSIATLEAMASGLPIVAANAHALPLLVQPGVNGDLYAPGSATDLAATISHVLGDEERRRCYAQASRKRACAHSFEKTVNEFQRIYKERN